MKLVFKDSWRLLLAGVLLASLGCGCMTRIPNSVKAQKDIVFAQAGGQPLKLDIYTPKLPEGKLPVVVWLHPGGWDMGGKSFCPIAFMAASNTAIVSVDYRLSGVTPFPAPLYDCKGAIRWLRANAKQYGLDPDRIGVFGASAGGHLALLLATTASHHELEGDVGGNLDYSSKVQCVCAFYPPTDLDALVTDPKERMKSTGEVAKLLGRPVGLNVNKAKAASPMTYLDKDCAPVFLLHGGADTLVPPKQSEMFYTAARKAGVDAHLVIVPNKGHGIIAPPAVAPEIYAFFNKYLGE